MKNRKKRIGVFLKIDEDDFEAYKELLKLNGMIFTHRIRLLILEDSEYIKNKMVKDKS